ncbi:UNVERIFIED_CONTAM: hypothetical protein FKN15_021659 [Acipenser sinensis]
MRFIDPEMETCFSVEKEKQSGAAFSCSCVVLFFTAIMEALIDPALIANYVTFVVGEILLLILTICSLAAIFPRVCKTLTHSPSISLPSPFCGSVSPKKLKHILFIEAFCGSCLVE